MRIEKLVGEKPTAELGILAPLRKLLYQIRGVHRDDRQPRDRFKTYTQPSNPPYNLQKSRLAAVYSAKLEAARGYYELGKTYHAIGNPEKSHETFQAVDRLLNELEAIQKIEQALGDRTF
ncbi:MAG: hypothetical protein LH660_05825 [Phormidesmis sp. CAN_BIN36]|nr:hypothetical protein [Phormidesmis sp. CAN_BIN36]